MGFLKRTVNFFLKRVKIEMILNNRNFFYTFFITYFTIRTSIIHNGVIQMYLPDNAS
jgi:hypothetical protein